MHEITDQTQAKNWAKGTLNPVAKEAFDQLSGPAKRKFRLLYREIAARRLSPLSLYEPTSGQLKAHVSQAREKLILGSNRSCKTTTAVFEVAMAVTGQHPYTDYPKENGRCVLVAKDGMALGEVLYRKLFKRGAIQMVFDKELMQFRAWHPWHDGYDQKVTKPCFPLIPKRLIKSVSWEDKGVDWPRKITLHNGWEMTFYTSNGKPPQGIDVDLCHFTEEILREEWYDEMSARLIDRGGRFIWDATPQAGTDKLWELHERAMDEVGTGSIDEFHFVMDDNPYISPKDKDDFKAKHRHNPEQYEVRVKGEFQIKSSRVYPNFSPTVHGCDVFDIPNHWTRYAVIDPGFSRSAALFAAVPPEHEDPHVYIYDEMFLERADVVEFARRFKAKMGLVPFEAFLIDKHGSRRTEMQGLSIGQQYEAEFQKLNIRSHRTKHGFIAVSGDAGNPFNDSTNDSVDQVRLWLYDRGDGLGPKLKYFREACTNFKSDMTKYHYGRTKGGSGRIKPDRRKWCEGCDCARYLVLYDPQWAKPRKLKEREHPMLAWIRKERREKQGNYVHLGSNG